MPFNSMLLSGGRRIFILDALTVEDLALAYNVEAEVASKFPGITTRAGDLIMLTLGAVDFVASASGGYAIDADGLHDEALFKLTMTTGCQLFGKGGKGGKGGNGFWEPEPPGSDQSSAGSSGGNGGEAIRYGCPTEIDGTGLISKGYGAGGGGGGGATAGNAHGGGGGGGGMPLGALGSGGSGAQGAGSDGSAATISALGAGGAAGGANAGAGGDGGDDTPTTQQVGANGLQVGGAAGTDGDAIHTQTFSHTAGGGITITGTVV